MKELLDKYKLMLSFLKVSTITPEKLRSVFQMFGKDVPVDVADIIVNMMSEMSKEKQIDSVGKLLLDPDINSQILGLIEQFDVPTKIGNMISGADHQEEANSLVHVDSLIPCTHCNKRVHIRSAMKNMH